MDSGLFCAVLIALAKAEKVVMCASENLKHGVL